MINNNDRKEQQSLQIARVIEHTNRQRKHVTNVDMKIVRKLIQTPQAKRSRVLVLFDPRLHAETVGIEASKVVDATGKPTLIIGHLVGEHKGVYRGSGRSIKAFNLFDALNPISNDMVSFGGHSMACGFRIKRTMIKKLRHDFEARSESLKNYQPTLKPNFIVNAHQINFIDLAQQISRLAPFGEGNPRPLIDLRTYHIYNLDQMGRDGRSLEMTISSDFRSMRVVSFGNGNLYEELKQQPRNVSLIGYLMASDFHGRKRLQFQAIQIGHYTVPDLNHQKMVQLYNYLYIKNHFHDQINYKNLTHYFSQEMDAYNVKLGLKILEELNLIHKDGSLVKHHPTATKLSNSKTYRKLM